LADAGRLDDALTSCEAALANACPSAGLYALLGVVHQARQESDAAERCFRKALYLQPDHPEALLHLMMLSEQRGNRAEAARLRRRLERRPLRGDS
jgi:chemotaxis protein methyltransferase WspC